MEDRMATIHRPRFAADGKRAAPGRIGGMAGGIAGLCGLALWHASPANVAAAELLPATVAIEDAIDRYVDAKLVEAAIAAAPRADDATLTRRLTLDLAGRVPSPEELSLFPGRADQEPASSAEGDEASRRQAAALIERLMNSRWYVRSLASALNAMLRGSGGDGPDLRDYLLLAVSERRPWDRMFREMMGTSPAPGGPQQFVQGRSADFDLLTRDVSSLFFGVNISCAQCHVHPYVETLTQDHFFGMKAFFSRGYVFEDRLLERRFAEARLKYVTNDGDQREIGPMFLTGVAVEAPTPAVDDLAAATTAEQMQIDELQKKNAERRKLDPNAPLEYPEAADVSLRHRFVEVALSPENAPLFSRAIVNRLWHHFMGYGLVMRIDQMHDGNPGSHPDLLAWLARDFREHGYDLHRTIRGIVSSRAYARSSRWPRAATASVASRGASPPRELFAVANLRPLTPLQFGVSALIVGDALPDETELSVEAFDAHVAALEKRALELFGTLIEQPYDDLQISAAEALGMSNAPELLNAVGEKLVPRLTALPDRSAQVRLAVSSVLSRPATLDEAVALTEFVVRSEMEQTRAGGDSASEGNPPRQAWRQAVWALCTSPEFRFNH
jgi:hypothetical protein